MTPAGAIILYSFYSTCRQAKKERTNEVRAMAIPFDPSRGPGALKKFKTRMSTYSRKTSTNTGKEHGVDNAIELQGEHHQEIDEHVSPWLHNSVQKATTTARTKEPEGKPH